MQAVPQVLNSLVDPSPSDSLRGESRLRAWGRPSPPPAAEPASYRQSVLPRTDWPLLTLGDTCHCALGCCRPQPLVKTYGLGFARADGGDVTPGPAMSPTLSPTRTLPSKGEMAEHGMEGMIGGILAMGDAGVSGDG